MRSQGITVKPLVHSKITLATNNRIFFAWHLRNRLATVKANDYVID